MKDSSSDEFEKNKLPFDLGENACDYDQKLYVMKDTELDKNDNYDIFSNNVNRSRSMLNRFNQNNTTDSRLNSKLIFPNTVKKRKIIKDDMSSESPHHALNISGNISKKVKNLG
jgi:hypothetical protein